MQLVRYRSPSGQTLRFTAHPFDPKGWLPLPGIYVFSRLRTDGSLIHEALYVGMTGSLLDRFPDHHKWDDAAAMGATHVLAMVEDRIQRRVFFESMLIQELRPPLNERGLIRRAVNARR